MYYEFYIDQFFLEQLLSAALLLELTLFFLREKVSFRRIAAGAVVCAAVETVLIWLGKPEYSIFGMPAAGIAVFGNRNLRSFLENMLVLFFMTLCFGGTLESLIRLTGFPLAAGMAVSAALLRFLFYHFRSREKEQEKRAAVTVVWENRNVQLEGLIDTGNQLTEPLTGRPVSILTPKAANELLPEHWEQRRGYYLIPYRSIGREQGWMRAVTADRMSIVKNGKEICVERPVLAVSPQSFGENGGYQMILHPKHVSGWVVRRIENSQGDRRE